MAKTFSIGTKRQIVDEKNLTKLVLCKVAVRAEDSLDALYKVKQWLSENTEKGKDYEVGNCTGSSIRERIVDERVGVPVNYEVVAEYKSDKAGAKGQRVSIIVVSDTNAHASTKAEVYLGEKRDVKIVSCKESSFGNFIGFE